MLTYHTYAAPSAKARLEPFTFDPGPLGPEEVEIEVSHCGLCHSDLSMLDNDWGMSKYPFVPGHEVTSTVSALGEQAKGLKIGRRRGGQSSLLVLSSNGPLMTGLLGEPLLAGVSVACPLYLPFL